jgi:hypothetical protein
LQWREFFCSGAMSAALTKAARCDRFSPRWCPYLNKCRIFGRRRGAAVSSLVLSTTAINRFVDLVADPSGDGG